VTIVMMRANATPEHADMIAAAAESMFAAIESERPEGIRYSAYRVGDTEIFVILLELQEGTENPLPGIAAVTTFQEDLRGGWLAEPPVMEQLTVVGEYRSF
jgi:hypothetical protein